MKATPGDFENHADMHDDLRKLRAENARLEREVGDTLTRLQSAHEERDAAREVLRELTDFLCDGTLPPGPGALFSRDFSGGPDNRQQPWLAELRKKGGLE